MDPTLRQALASTADGPTARHAVPGTLVGKLVDERFEVLDFLGAGAMGEVYRVRDRELDELVALKVLHRELSERPDLVERFRREVKLARRVTHRSVARTFELGFADGIRFLTMELVDGEPLSDILVRRGPLSVDVCVGIAKDVCDALDAAHAVGVVHRDIKPDNILVTPQGRVVVTDFGVARLAHEGTSDSSGTPGYMAPEQVRGEAPSALGDVYALGATLFEACTGRLPFEGPSAVAILAARLSRPPPDPRSIVADLPPSFADLILRALATSPAERFSSARTMRDELDALGAPTLQRGSLEIAPRDWGPAELMKIEVAAIARVPPALGHVAGALTDELTFRIGRIPRVRIVAGGADAGEIVLSSTAVGGGSRVVMQATSVSTGETLWSGRFPLEGARVAQAADAISRFLAVVLEAPPVAATLGPEAGADVLELCQRARHHYHSGVGGDLARAIALYDEARRRAPSDPMVLAGWAMAFARHATFADDAPGSLEEAAAAARAALAGAPSRPEAHLAAGHLELHVGDPTIAARRFREALRLAPAWPEAHEWLGRMLLEAGYVEDGVRRLDTAMRLDPQIGASRAEIARAYALEARWDDCDRVLRELTGPGNAIRGRWISRARVASWHSPERLAEVQAAFAAAPAGEVFDHAICRAVFESMADRAAFPAHRALFVARAEERFASLRRSAFYCEVGAEVALLCGDFDTGFDLLERGIARGLFDLHWLDECPTIEAARTDRRFGPLRAQVEARAHAVLDALYGG